MARGKRHAPNPHRPGFGLCGNTGRLMFARAYNPHRVTCKGCLRELEWQDSAFLKEK